VSDSRCAPSAHGGFISKDGKMSSLKAQIAEVEREITLRRQVYPRQVSRGNMKQAQADIHLARMLDVLDTLKQLAKGDGLEELLR
jgi:hypothetical protein